MRAKTAPKLVPLVLAAVGAGVLPTACREAPAPARTPLVGAFAEASWLDAEPVLELTDAGGEDGRLPRPEPSPAWVLGDGWGRRQRWGTWGLGLRSVVDVNVLDPTLTAVWLEARPYHPHPGQPQRVAVSVNGTPCGEVTLAPRWRRYRVHLPGGVLRVGVNHLELGYAYSDSPRALGRRDDRRQLAVAVRRLGLGRRGGPPPGPALGVARGVERVVLTRPGRMLVPLTLPAGAGELALGATLLERGSEARPARLTLRLVRLDGSEQELASVARTGAGPLLAPASRFRLPAGAAGPAFLEIEARFGAGSLVALDRPSLLAPPPPVASEPTATPRRSEPARPPDIVVILLDAARPDHFGCYGYRRDTTPNIDRLAAESLVFRHAYAESPYTVASIPTLLTGLPPTVHGVLAPTQSLSAEARTVVEYLHGVGYATVGLSASPNNAPARGVTRGYDEFEDIWHAGLAFTEAIDPYTLSRRAVNRLERGFGDRPLFMLMHFVPPHEPYAPPSRFDLFSDPGYRGSVDGSGETLARIRHGLLNLGPADRQHLVDLYDGNLRYGDDAVGRVLAALRARPRWDDTVVVVLADHGEAFFEHGEQGHNTTVYEEMIRVPLIVRLPPAVRDGAIDTGRPVTLGDVAPTLLHLAGVTPDRPLPAEDLLAREGRRGVRVIVARSDGDNPQWAVVAGRYRALARGRGRRELYDLERDPGEHADLAARRPLLLDQLVRLLDERTEAGGPGPDQHTLSPAEAAALRSLGYL